MDWQELKDLFEQMQKSLCQLDIKMIRDEFDKVGIQYFLYDVDVENQSLIFIHQDVLRLTEMGPLAKSLYVDSAMIINIIKKDDIVNEIHQALMVGEKSNAWICIPKYYRIVEGRTKERIDMAVERLQRA